MNRSLRIMRKAGGITAFLWRFSLFASVSYAALDPAFPIERFHQDVWDTDQGLPQNTVAAILQSRDGYIWFGTELGLVRFDGLRFSVFDKSNVPGLGSNVVDALLEDHEGALWIGTVGGGLLRYSHGGFRTFGVKDGLSSDSVLSLLEDRAGTLWVGTGGGLNRFHDDHFSSFTVKDGLSNNEVYAMAQSRSGDIWIGTHSGLNILTRTGIQKYEPQSALGKAIIKALYVDRNGSLWAGVHGIGLLNVSNGKSATWTTGDGLANSAITAIKEDSAGSLWVGTIGGGLIRKTKYGFTSYTSQSGLPINDIWSLLEDRDGNLWIGTGGGGLARLSEGKPFSSYGKREGLASSAALPIFEDHEHNVWIGTNGGGIDRLRDGKFTHFTTADGLADNLIFTICEDASGALWIGTHKGLSRYKDGKFTTFSSKDGLPSDIVFASLKDHEGNVWLGTRGGLVKWRDGKFTTYKTEDGLSSNIIQSIYEDSKGMLWIGTAGGGLNKLDHGKFETFDSRQGLANGFVWSIHESSDGTLWLGTNGGGLYRFKSGHFTPIMMKDGLLDDAVFEVLEDDARNLWMSSNRGVFRAGIEQLNDFADKKIGRIGTVAYGRADGLNTKECNGGFQPAGLRSHDGKLWFPTMKGVAVVDPRRASQPEPAPPTKIEAAVINHQPVNTQDGGVNIPPGRGDIEIAYSAPSFKAPEKIVFRYLLEGFDREWVDAGDRRNAYYTKVPPGHYTFRVVASYDGGQWGSSLDALPITLEAHFYQTAWFYTTCALGLILAAFGANRVYLKYLAERRELLELLVYRKTSDLRNEVRARRQAEAAAEDAKRMKNEFLKNVSEEISSPIQGIIGANDFVLATPLTTEQQKHLGIIRQSAQTLLSRLNELFNFASK